MGKLKVFDDAIEKTAKRMGVETDPDVMKYESLNKDDFDGLVRRYGFEDVRRYIQTMETKRIGIPPIFRKDR